MSCFDDVVDCQVGIVLDVDGVLMHGSHGIAGAKEAVQRARERAPVLLLTNGSGSAERRAAQVRGALGLGAGAVEAGAVVLSHTPLRSEEHRAFLQSARLVVVSRSQRRSEEVAAEHGWNGGVVSVQELLRAHPQAVPILCSDAADADDSERAIGDGNKQPVDKTKSVFKSAMIGG